VRYFKRGAAYTMSVLWSPQDWHDYASISRYSRYLCNWPLSQTAWITAPVIGILTAWSVVVLHRQVLGICLDSAIMSDVGGRLAPEDNVSSLTWYTCSIGAQARV
jgi:hypothetical protein